MGFGDTFNFFGYVSDNGTTYSVKLSDTTASEGGFAPLAGPLSAPAWPFNSKNMRHVWGVSGGTKRARLPIAANDNAKYTTGGSFELHGDTYIIEGIIGEARKVSAIGG